MTEQEQSDIRHNYILLLNKTYFYTEIRNVTVRIDVILCDKIQLLDRRDIYNMEFVTRALIGEEERLGGSCGPARGEELLVQVLGHVHYLPAAWRGRAHTRHVAAHLQHMFQFRAVRGIF